MKTGTGKNAFTLVEVLVASVIAAFVALVAVGTLRAVVTSADMVEANIARTSQARYGIERIGSDLRNLYRGQESAEETVFVGMAEESERGVTSSLIFRTVGRIQARTAQPEGEIYEVEYYLLEDKESGQKSLVRRLWPNPDQQREPGGMLSIIAEDIQIFEVRYFDGEQWVFQWAEELRQIPQIVEVTLVAAGIQDRQPAIESVMITFARRPGVSEDAGTESDIGTLNEVSEYATGENGQ